MLKIGGRNMMIDRSATVVVNGFSGGGVQCDAFESKEAMIRHFIEVCSFTGCWGDTEHLEALKRLQELLTATIERVSEEEKRRPQQKRLEG